MLRWTIPADDQWHEVNANGGIAFVATRAEPYAEVWTIVHDDFPEENRSLRIYGTGAPIDSGGDYIGSAITPSGRLVWHVFARDVAS
jgi:hypothetical protein